MRLRSAITLLILMLPWAGGARAQEMLIATPIGGAVLVQGGGGTAMLLDGGPRGESGALLAALARCGVTELTLVAATGAAGSRIGGLCDVLEVFATGDVWIPAGDGSGSCYRYLQRLSARRGFTLRAPRDAQSLSFAGATLTAAAGPDACEWTLTLGETALRHGAEGTVVCSGEGTYPLHRTYLLDGYGVRPIGVR